MKIYISTIAAAFLLLFSACDKDTETENYSAFFGSYNNGNHLQLILKDKDGNNLLDSSTPNFVEENNISIEYEHPSFRNYISKPRDAFSIEEVQGEIALSLLLELPNNAVNIPTDEIVECVTHTYLNLGKKDRNVLKAHYQIYIHKNDVQKGDVLYGNASCLLMKIFFNDKLIWEKSDTDERFPVVIIK